MSPSPTIAVPTPPAVPAVCPDTELMPAPDNIARVRAATLCLINQQRIAADELALAPNRALAQAAQAHDDDMVAHDYFAHNGPAGDTPLSRILSTGYIVGDVVGYVIGENIAWGTYDLATPAAIVTAWMSSPEHRANILDACFRDTAIAVDPEAPHSLAPNDPGAIYDQEFGVLRWPPLRQRHSGGVAPAASHG